MTIDDLAGAVAQADAAPLDLAVALIRPFIADIGWLEGLLARECAALAVDPQHMPPWRAGRRGGARHLVLARTERIWVSASCIDPARDEAAHPDRVHLSGRYTLCRPLGRPLRGRDFRLRDGRLVSTGVLACAAGSWFERDERSETVRIMPESGRVLLLRAQVAPPGAVVAGLYDMADGMPTVRAQVDERHARLLMLLSLLRLQRRTDAAPLFEAALDAPLGGQRWAVMREYLALDTVRAQPSLEKMALRDPEEKVRDMARRTMAQARAVSCPQVIDPPADDRMLDLDGLVDWCEGPDFDPRDAEGLAQAGVMLRALARNRHFLADMAIAELKSRCIAQRRDNPYSAQVLLLRPPSRHYVLRAAFWPAACDHVVRTSGTAAFLYHVPHDHGFDFLTIGYLGPGYASDHYEYDGDTVTGIAGEPVALRFIARDCLSEGRMLLYRANRDVHVQHPAQSLSVSLNILAATPGQEWRRQYRFDVAQGIIAECMTLSSSQMLLELAVGSGTGNALDLAEDFARRHHEDAMRHTAWAAIADVQPDPVLRLAHLEQGTRSSSPLIRRASRTALHNIHNGHEMDCSAPADAVGSQEQAGGR